MTSTPKHIKKLIIGKNYILVWFDFIFAGTLVGKDFRHAYELKTKLVKGKEIKEKIDLGPQYDVLVFTSEDEVNVNRGIVEKIFNGTVNKKQFYFTRPIINESNIIDGIYDWFISKIADVFMNITSEVNLNINMKIAESMLIKKGVGQKEVKMIIDLLKLKGTEIILDKQMQWKEHCAFLVSQLPFD